MEDVSYKGVVYPFGAFHREFDKNANSIDVKAEMFFVLFSLATIGVCVFCAVTSVAALFILGEMKKMNHCNCSDSSKDAIESIEKRVANYYNDTYLNAGKSGKYVVLHHETTVSGDLCNVIVRYQDNDGFDDRSAYAPVADVSVNMITGDCTVHSRPTKKISKRTGAHVFICIIAVIILLNIVCIPFLCNELWSIEDISDHAYSFSDMIEGIVDDMHYGYSFYLDDEVPILYYFGGLVCTLFIFIGALGKSSGVCTFGSLAGTGLSLYVFYQIYLGTTRYYVSGNNAYLTFGFYISCAGFVSILIASLYQKQE